MSGGAYKMGGGCKPTRAALQRSRARIFVGQLEPFVTEQDLYPVFGCYGKVLHLNVVRHSTNVTPHEERRIPTAFVWYETTEEADAAIAALHNQFSFTPLGSEDDHGGRRRYIQVSYAKETPEQTVWGRWQQEEAERHRRSSNNNNNNGGSPRHHDGRHHFRHSGGSGGFEEVMHSNMASSSQYSSGEWRRSGAALSEAVASSPMSGGGERTTALWTVAGS